MNLREIRKKFPELPDCCQRCRLFLECTSYKIPMRQLHSGKPYEYISRNATAVTINPNDALPDDLTIEQRNPKKVLIVVMNPGKDEDKQNKILVGRSSQLLDSYIKEYFSDYDVWATNAVKCYNPQTKLKIDHIRYCNEFLQQDIVEFRPDIIVTMGDIAKQAIAVTNEPDRILSIPTEYTHHPAYVLRGNPDDNIRNTFIRVDATLRDELVKIPYQPWGKGIVEKILRRAYDTKHIAIDFEWDVTDNSVHTVGFSTDSDCTAIDIDTGRYLIKELYSNPDITLVGHNIKEDTKRAIEMGFIVNCKFQDTLVLTRELTPWIMKKKLSDFCSDYLLFPRYWSDITTDDYKQYSPQLAEYCAGDCFAAYKLYENYMTDFGDEWEVMWEANQIDMAMVYPTALMELQGIKLDLDKAMQYKGELETDVLQLENKIEDDYGVNPGSPSQVKDKLIELGFDVKNTSRETLVGIDHEFVRNILQFRKMDKLVDTYYKPLPELVDKDDILHTSLHICGMVTGRMGSSKPNLQNIPKSRRDMICSIYGADGVLVSADRSQSEYRCLVYMAQHGDLIDAYLDNPNLDMHQWASDVLGVDRYTAKTMNFAALYGASRWRLVKELVKKGMTEYDAGEKVDRYLPQILAFSRYQNGLVSFYNQYDFIESPYGRRFYNLDGRQIANYPVQSFSADLNKKLSVLYLFNEMKRLGLRSRVWLEYHDAAELDVYKPELDTVREILRSVPQTIPDVLGYGVELPLPTEIKEHGRYWS